MTDMELLELAAKAAGLKVRCVGNGEPNGGYSFYAGPGQLWWNPLIDDGAALRLAVKLQLGVAVYDNRADAMDGETVDLYEMIDGDPYAATRRAIVRAAAEIGRSKE